MSDLEDERNKLKEQVAELSTRISSLEGEHITNPAQSRLELKVKELDSKLELEQTTRGRMDTQINRLKEAIEKLNHETDSLRHKEAAAQDSARKLQRQLRELKEDYANLQQKETETNAKKSEYEKLHELSEAETITARNDLKLALKRIEDLQTAINGELDSELSDLARLVLLYNIFISCICTGSPHFVRFHFVRGLNFLQKNSHCAIFSYFLTLCGLFMSYFGRIFLLILEFFSKRLILIIWAIIL